MGRGSNAAAGAKPHLPLAPVQVLPLLGLVALAFLLSFFKVTSSDTFTHLRAGMTILEQGSLLHRNTFSATYADYPWTNTEWLFQVALAGAFRAGGWLAIAIVKVAGVALVGILLYRTLLFAAPCPLLAFSLTSIALCGMQFRFTERPHLCSYLFFCLTVLISHRNARTPSRGVWVLPFLFAVWSNVHPELIVGLAYLGARVAGNAVGNRLQRGTWRCPDRRFLAVSLLCVPASVLNPGGAHVLLMPFQHLFLGATVQVTEFAASTTRFVPAFWGILVLTAAVLALFRREPDWGEVLQVGGTALLGVLYLRAIPYFLLAATPVLYRHLARWKRAATAPGARRADLAAILGAALAIFWAVGFDRLVHYQWGWGIDTALFPEAPARLLLEADLPDNLYNSFYEGGFLMFRLYPRRGVFVDGRVPAYPPEFIRRQYSGFSEAGWSALMEEHNVNTALVETRSAGVLFPPAAWATVFWDAAWSVLVRRSAAPARILKELEYRLYLPGSDIFRINRPEQLAELVREMERARQARLEPSPYLENDLGLVYRKLQRREDAERAFARALEIEPALEEARDNLDSLRRESR